MSKITALCLIALAIGQVALGAGVVLLSRAVRRLAARVHALHR